MEEQQKPGAGQRLGRFIRRHWTDREILLRADGRVRFLRFSRASQALLLIPTAALLFGIGGVAYDYYEKRTLLTQKTEELDRSRLAYLDLLSDVTDYQEQFAAITKNFEDNQAYLLSVLEQNAALRKNIADVAKEMKSSDMERSQMLIVRETLRRRLETFESELDVMSDDHPDLESHVDVLRARLRASEAERLQISDTRDALQGRVDSLQAELRGMEERNGQLETSLSDLKRALADVKRDYAEASLQRDRFTKSLAEAEGRLVQVSRENESLRSGNEELQEQLTRTTDQRNALDQERDMLAREVASLRREMLAARSHNSFVEATLERTEASLGLAIEERILSDTRRDELQHEVDRLNRRVIEIQDSQYELVSRLTDRTRANIETVEKTVAMTGIDLAAILAKTSGRSEGQGGPFVAVVEGLDLPKEYEAAVQKLDLEVERWAGLQQVLSVLPITPPVDQYRLSSGFGHRIDPINKKPALHAGLDFAAPRGTKIYAPAPGKVVYAGWRGNYGRFIEIDHGLGIMTRYGHLHRLSVKKGEKVDFRELIGQVGNSGRSTGSHLHYEVTIDGEPVDPQNFLTAGRYVFKK